MSERRFIRLTTCRRPSACILASTLLFGLEIALSCDPRGQLLPTFRYTLQSGQALTLASTRETYVELTRAADKIWAMYRMRETREAYRCIIHLVVGLQRSYRCFARARGKRAARQTEGTGAGSSLSRRRVSSTRGHVRT